MLRILADTRNILAYHDVVNGNIYYYYYYYTVTKTRMLPRKRLA